MWPTLPTLLCAVCPRKDFPNLAYAQIAPRPLTSCVRGAALLDPRIENVVGSFPGTICLRAYSASTESPEEISR